MIHDTTTSAIYTLSLHDALPISRRSALEPHRFRPLCRRGRALLDREGVLGARTPQMAAHSLPVQEGTDRKSTRLNSSHVEISYAVFCLKKKKLRNHSSNES